jgi:hypothetical protein
MPLRAMTLSGETPVSGARLLWLVPWALWHLATASRYVHTHTFDAVIQSVKAMSRRPDRRIGSRDLEFIQAAFIVAVRMYPGRLACLETAYGAYRALRVKGAPSAFVIAVRHSPFSAHAWVEAGGRKIEFFSRELELFEIMRVGGSA